MIQKNSLKKSGLFEIIISNIECEYQIKIEHLKDKSDNTLFSHLTNCTHHANHKSFQVPKKLIEDFLNNRVVFFAGAGISTESSISLKPNFYDSISDVLELEDQDLPFSKLMQIYENQNSRIELLEKIKKRLTNIKSFPELKRVSTFFHRELSSMFFIDTIVTTNWDTFFEDECGAIPFVSDEDLSFWDMSHRKVLKIHGSINNLGSIIATTNDYKKSYKRLMSGLLGGKLKDILATKTIVYCGYSLRDDDFQQINNFVKKQMKGLTRKAYFISPDSKSNDFKKEDIIHIQTDGTYFLKVIKNEIKSKLQDIYSDDIIYDYIYFQHKYITEIHMKLSNELNLKEIPELVMSLMFQDGLIHCFERALEMKKEGQYSNKVYLAGVIENYQKMKINYIKKNKYEDIAYLDGYICGLFHIANYDKNLNPVPAFYIYEYEDVIYTYKEFLKLKNDIRTKYKRSYKRSYEIISKLNNNDEKIIIHHPPYL